MFKLIFRKKNQKLNLKSLKKKNNIQTVRESLVLFNGINLSTVQTKILPMNKITKPVEPFLAYVNKQIFFTYTNQTQLPLYNVRTLYNEVLNSKITLLVITYWNLIFAGRFKHKIIKSIYNVIFFENTIILKNLFFLWIKLLPLQKHKKLIVVLFENIIFIEFFAYLFFIKFQILFYIKGKLGLKGDNKKKKDIFAARPEYKHRTNTGLFYDGIGSASRFGLTFFKIAYTQSDYSEFQDYEYPLE